MAELDNKINDEQMSAGEQGLLDAVNNKGISPKNVDSIVKAASTWSARQGALSTGFQSKLKEFVYDAEQDNPHDQVKVISRLSETGIDFSDFEQRFYPDKPSNNYNAKPEDEEAYKIVKKLPIEVLDYLKRQSGDPDLSKSSLSERHLSTSESDDDKLAKQLLEQQFGSVPDAVESYNGFNVVNEAITKEFSKLGDAATEFNVLNESEVGLFEAPKLENFSYYMNLSGEFDTRVTNKGLEAINPATGEYEPVGSEFFDNFSHWLWSNKYYTGGIVTAALLAPKILRGVSALTANPVTTALGFGAAQIATEVTLGSFLGSVADNLALLNDKHVEKTEALSLAIDNATNVSRKDSIYGAIGLTAIEAGLQTFRYIKKINGLPFFTPDYGLAVQKRITELNMTGDDIDRATAPIEIVKLPPTRNSSTITVKSVDGDERVVTAQQQQRFALRDINRNFTKRATELDQFSASVPRLTRKIADTTKNVIDNLGSEFKTSSVITKDLMDNIDLMQQQNKLDFQRLYSLSKTISPDMPSNDSVHLMLSNAGKRPSFGIGHHDNEELLKISSILERNPDSKMLIAARHDLLELTSRNGYNRKVSDMLDSVDNVLKETYPDTDFGTFLERTKSFMTQSQAVFKTFTKYASGENLQDLQKLTGTDAKFLNKLKELSTPDLYKFNPQLSQDMDRVKFAIVFDKYVAKDKYDLTPFVKEVKEQGIKDDTTLKAINLVEHVNKYMFNSIPNWNTHTTALQQKKGGLSNDILQRILFSYKYILTVRLAGMVKLSDNSKALYETYKMWNLSGNANDLTSIPGASLVFKGDKYDKLGTYDNIKKILDLPVFNSEEGEKVLKDVVNKFRIPVREGADYSEHVETITNFMQSQSNKEKENLTRGRFGNGFYTPIKQGDVTEKDLQIRSSQDFVNLKNLVINISDVLKGTSAGSNNEQVKRLRDMLGAPSVTDRTATSQVQASFASEEEFLKSDGMSNILSHLLNSRDDLNSIVITDKDGQLMRFEPIALDSDHINEALNYHAEGQIFARGKSAEKLIEDEDVYTPEQINLMKEYGGQ